MGYLLRFLLILTSVFTASGAWAQYEGLMYAEVALKDRSSVTGLIRWSGGQMLWSDILLVSKTEQYALKYLNQSQINALSDDSGLDWAFINLWKEKLPQRQNELLCRFGDIGSIHVTGPEQAQIYFKNGAKLRVATDQHENRHLGKDITVFDGGKRKIGWNQISRINFRSAPENFQPFQGRLLYGTVSTKNGDFSGFIQWDKIKFFSTQKLEGKLNSESTTDNEYRFDLIQNIEKRDKGAMVKFKDDKKIFLKNNRDVNASNRGIVVMHPEWGRVIIGWEAFKSVEFTEVPNDLGYSSYPPAKRIYATVKRSDGKVFKGNCTFDLDEEWNNELLEGSVNNIHYQIPFKFIRSISVLNEQQSQVVLRNNRTLALANHNDVTSKNWGVIIWLGNSKHQYVPWDKIADISFR